MQQIINPTIKLHTIYRHQGTYINALVLTHGDNAYHIQGATTDIIYCFHQSLGIYVLIVNKGIPYVALHSYMSSEPDPINSTLLRNLQEVSGVLGKKWETMEPLVMVQKLINYLY
jgi:hypothetical protein